MKNLLILLVSLLLSTAFSHAQTVIRIRSGQPIESIIDNVTTVAGTVLLLDPGSYVGFTVRKRVSIIGSGSFGTNASTINGSVTFSENNNSNSDNSYITGCSVDGIQVNQDNIAIQKCRVNTVFTGINIGNVNNCKVLQCFLIGTIGIDGAASNFTIQGNIIQNRIDIPFTTGAASGKIIYNTVGSNDRCVPMSSRATINGMAISNNIFISPIVCDNRDSRTNYQTNFFAKFNNNVVRLGNYQSADLSNKFLNNENMAQVLFTATATSVDGQYILSANSPAKGAGEGGTDIGAFGGPEPYVIGGAPLGPTITELQVPSTARQNETIQIRLKARVQN